MKKRTRCDTNAGKAQAMENALKGVPKPPKHVYLPLSSVPFWEAIMNSRAYHLWSQFDLVTASTLANINSRINRLQSEVEAEGYIVESKGDKTINLKYKILDKQIRLSVSLSRFLHVHPQATLGRSENNVKVLAAQKQMQRFVEQNEYDGLIPYPKPK